MGSKNYDVSTINPPQAKNLATLLNGICESVFSRMTSIGEETVAADLNSYLASCGSSYSYEFTEAQFLGKPLESGDPIKYILQFMEGEAKKYTYISITNYSSGALSSVTSKYIEPTKGSAIYKKNLLALEQIGNDAYNGLNNCSSCAYACYNNCTGECSKSCGNSGCQNSCSGACSNACTGGCNTDCTSSACSGECSSACSGCSGSCWTNCSYSCGDACSGATCATNCGNGCKGDCNDSCSGNCYNGCADGACASGCITDCNATCTKKCTGCCTGYVFHNKY